MLTLTIIVRDNDEAVLRQAADRDWRDSAELEASALLEQALATERRKLKPHTGKRGPRGSQAG